MYVQTYVVMGLIFCINLSAVFSCIIHCVNFAEDDFARKKINDKLTLGSKNAKISQNIANKLIQLTYFPHINICNFSKTFILCPSKQCGVKTTWCQYYTPDFLPIF
jgi:hypothetical protein